MKKLKFILSMLLAFVVLVGCSDAKNTTAEQDNSKEAVDENKPINVKARYVGTTKKDNKQLVKIEVVNADFATYDVIVKLKIEGKNAEGKEVTETLEAECKKVEPGEIKEFKISPKKVTEPKKVTIQSVTKG